MAFEILEVLYLFEMSIGVGRNIDRNSYRIYPHGAISSQRETSCWLIASLLSSNPEPWLAEDDDSQGVHLQCSLEPAF
jgi:hypothetical protein